jgi:type VI secretion system protein ImpK
LTFRDNAHLSRERAERVADMLKQSLESPARVVTNGLGSSKPLVPETDPESRARNRRVEIVHISGV